MEKRNKNVSWIGATLAILALSTLVFKDSFTNYFFGDDFYHFWLLKNQSVFDGFNLFSKPVAGYFGYRPVPNQVYWRLGEAFFGFNPVGYHLINYLFFATGTLLVGIFAFMLTKSKKIGTLAVFFYALNSTHFYRLFFLSNIEETMMTVFVLLTLILYLKKSRYIY